MGDGVTGHLVANQCLQLRLSRWSEWERYRESSQGLFCPTATPPAIGREMRIEVTFLGGPRFRLRGTVSWRRLPGEGAGARPGVGIHIYDPYRSTLDFIDAWATDSCPDRRQLRRLPLRLPLTYEAQGRRWVNFTRDVSPGGLFIPSTRLLEANDFVNLRIMGPHGSLSFQLVGRITHRVARIHLQGVGLELQFPDEETRAEFAAFLELLEQRLSAGRPLPALLTGAAESAPRLTATSERPTKPELPAVRQRADAS